MNDRIINVTFPTCGTCRYAQGFKPDKMAECFGRPPVPLVLGSGKDAIGRPVLQIEAMVPRVKEDRPACGLYERKQDFATIGKS